MTSRVSSVKMLPPPSSSRNTLQSFVFISEIIHLQPVAMAVLFPSG